MSLYSMLTPNGPNGFGYGSTAEETTEGVSLDGKTMLVTGCNSGIGLETLRVLKMRGAHVIGAARTAEKATAAGASSSVACELSDPASVRACVDTLKKKGVKFDAIVCNAGIMALPKLQQAFGFELQFFTNHIGHFILVTGLLDLLADDGRVVIVSSDAHRRAPPEGIQFDNLSGEKSYSPWAAYGQSKLANLLFAKELARRFSGTKKTANALHPGVIRTNLVRNMGPTATVANVAFFIAGPIALKSIPQGAATQTYLAANPAAASFSGEYFSSCNVAQPRRDATDAGLAKKLWEESEKIVAGLN